ncbi:hypothetical protein BU24DRAFT_471892 [Aaosphaeria arxii CBS 175.79]|uniref:Uncharacterized protein n=1 Tax=Aaosphaeria arxii CBS 175.79 TaxID=1450172 RepID=A0A6A5XCW9_9PLEO|nr:uncharacterized protein BU24DRAFT_471892 [Aaosphaeria arxii CBS 175.79]KAF2010842.1 hypothetical protein BU24DRAFT_471892 [Aaosphaeria arxii CBS 175.79]
MRRVDEIRLLYLMDASYKYPSPPMCPWAPLDTVGIETCAIEVREHIRCGHRPIYQFWTWRGGGGQRQEDYELTAPPPALLRQVFQAFLTGLETLLCSFNGRVTTQITLVSDQTIQSMTLSEVATRNAFTWTLSDGTKPEDVDYWKHEWLDGLLNGFEDDAQDTSTSEDGDPESNEEYQDEFARARTSIWAQMTREDDDS